MLRAGAIIPNPPAHLVFDWYYLVGYTIEFFDFGHGGPVSCSNTPAQPTHVVKHTWYNNSVND